MDNPADYQNPDQQNPATQGERADGERADDYQTLGLAAGTPLKAVQQEYLKLINTWNPKAVNPEASPDLFEMTRARHEAINAAYQRIADQFTPEYVEENATVRPPDGTQIQTESPLSDSTLLEPGFPGPDEVAEPASAQLEDAEVESPVTELEPVGMQSRGAESASGLPPELPLQTSAEREDDRVISRSFDRNEPHPSNSPAAVFSLLRWDKPAGRLILMIPALWAAFLAAGSAQPSWQILLYIILGSIATSAVGCAVNDLWDQDIDPLVERTQNRPLAAGTMSREMAIIVAVVAGLIAIVIALLLNPLSKLLCVAAAMVILLYPGAKRVFPVPQLVLAIAWGFAVLIGWTAVSGTLPRVAWILWLATVLWTLGFDTVYAMADREDDARIGVKSSALFFGDRSPQAVGLFFIGTAIMLLWLGLTLGLGVWYWISLCLATLGWLSHFRRLDNSKIRSTSRIYGLIFNQNVWLGLLLLFGIVFGRGGV